MNCGELADLNAQLDKLYKRIPERFRDDVANIVQMEQLLSKEETY